MERIILKDFMTPLVEEALKPRRWDIAAVSADAHDELERFFLEGWEPFAVTTLPAALSQQIWLRRRILIEGDPE